MNNWYVVHTKPRLEKLAQSSLQRAGVEVFLPQIKQTQWFQKREQVVFRPLFPGYLFVQFDVQSQYRAVVFARGVKSLLVFGSELAIVDKEIIDAIQARQVNGYIELRTSSFVPGQVVRIQKEPFHDLEAVFQKEMGDHQRAVLLLRTLSYQAHVIVNLRDVANL